MRERHLRFPGRAARSVPGAELLPDLPAGYGLPALIIALSLALGCSPSARGEIYRWTDAQGRVQLSDRPPPDGAKDGTDISKKYQQRVPFSIRIIPVDYQMPPQTHAKVEVAVSKIHEILQSRLGLDFRADPSFTVRIFNDRQSYTRYAEGSPLAGTASGYYSAQSNEAVTWRQNNFEQMLEVITHEANHALLRQRLGNVPPWLNEGLSEYFERMEVFGQAVVIHPNPQWDAAVRRQVRNGTIEPLRKYLTLSQQDWQLHDLSGNRSYAEAWSFVYFLMSTPEGTRLLSNLLETLDRVGAADFSGPDVINADFEGGLAALESRWHAWALGPKQAHHY